MKTNEGFGCCDTSNVKVYQTWGIDKDFPKPLLKIGVNTILGRILDDIDGIPKIGEHIIITNHKFANIFEDWA